MNWDLTNYRNAAQYILKFQHFVEKLQINSTLLASAQEKLSFDNITNINFDSLLRLIIAHDLKTSVEAMGKPYNIEEKEYIMVMQAYATAIPQDYHSLGIDPANSFIMAAAQNTVTESRITFPYKHQELYLSMMLEELSLYIEQTEYLDLLHDSCTFIASLDDIITEEEVQFLNTLDQKKSLALCYYSKGEEINKKSQARTSNSAIVSLNSLIGLRSVKKEISSLCNFVKIQQLRKDRGMNTAKISYHTVFTGKPGTGKTTVARIVAQIYKDLGIIKKGHLVETDRSGLVGEYIGQTAPKTNQVIDSALDGVLFIDEAYSLVQNSENDYGHEAIATLLKRMEDDRDRLIVILAGYSEEMEKFINSNSGLRSRFNRYIDFPDYDGEELFEIFVSNLKKHEYVATANAKSVVKNHLNNIVKNKTDNFGNARYVRNLTEKILTQQANRLSDMQTFEDHDLERITADDVYAAIW